jgi:hypothetical protein
MNVVNRVVLVILLLAAIPLCTILVVWPVPVLEAAGVQLAALVAFLNSLQWYVRALLGILFALTLNIIFILFLVLELRRPTPKAIRVEKATGGEVLVGVRSIADGLRYEIDQLSSVLRSRSKISARRGGVVVELDVEMAAGIDVPEKAEQIVETARRVVEERMGLKLARPPRVNLRTVSYPSTPRVPARPREGWPAVPERQPLSETPETES